MDQDTGSISDGEDEVDRAEGDAEADEEVKLERRRERNRVKQRNLRSESPLSRHSPQWPACSITSSWMCAITMSCITPHYSTTFVISSDPST